MLPISNKPPPDPPPSTPKSPELSFKIKKYFQFLQPYLSFHHPRLWLILSILLLQLVLLLTTCSPYFTTISSTSYSQHHLPTPFATATASIAASSSARGRDETLNSSDGIQCPYGRVFVYDLPPYFNTELVQNCQDLDPWSRTSGCDAISNNGFGKIAKGISEIVPENIAQAWYWTDQFPLEVIHHNRMMNYRCRSLEPESATAFYIPFYAGLDVGRYLWSKDYTAKELDRDCEMMLNWVHNQPYWNRSDGWDHFMTMGRISWDFRRSEGHDWGSSCIYLPGMRNITRLLIERNPWDYFDVGVPYPTGFHPRSAADITSWQNFLRTRQRKTLYCFAGGTRGFIKNDFRGLLLSQCYNEPESCRVLDCAKTKCSNGTTAILETFLDSNFCLQPRGDSFTRRSLFDCMVAGSIPVLFWRRTAYMQYEWFLPGEPDSYSVFIDRIGVKNGTISVKNVLENISAQKIKMMREKVIENLPKIVYAQPKEGLDGIADAFDIAVEGILRRVKEQEGMDKW